MIRTLLATTALIASFPAFAQETSAVPAQPAPTEQTSPTTAMPETASPAATAATPATPATPAEPAATPQANATQANASDQVAQVVDTQFPSFDADKSGLLEKPEFTSWMVALKDAELKASGKTEADAAKKEWAQGAFLTADSDKSASVSKEELVKFLSGAA